MVGSGRELVLVLRPVVRERYGGDPGSGPARSGGLSFSRGSRERPHGGGRGWMPFAEWGDSLVRFGPARRAEPADSNAGSGAAVRLRGLHHPLCHYVRCGRGPLVASVAGGCDVPFRANEPAVAAPRE